MRIFEKAGHPRCVSWGPYWWTICIALLQQTVSTPTIKCGLPPPPPRGKLHYTQNKLYNALNWSCIYKKFQSASLCQISWCNSNFRHAIWSMQIIQGIVKVHTFGLLIKLTFQVKNNTNLLNYGLFTGKCLCITRHRLWKVSLSELQCACLLGKTGWMIKAERLVHLSTSGNPTLCFPVKLLENEWSENVSIRIKTRHFAR